MWSDMILILWINSDEFIITMTWSSSLLLELNKVSVREPNKLTEINTNEILINTCDEIVESDGMKT